jgi:hypothetical protein
MIEGGGNSSGPILTVADHTVLPEDSFAALMITTRREWTKERTLQAKSLVNKTFQAEATANVRHEPKFTP